MLGKLIPFRSHPDTWTLGIVITAVALSVWFFSHGPMVEPMATRVQLRAAVRDIQVVGEGVARIEIQLDTMVIDLSELTILRAQLDSCRRGIWHP